MKNVLVIGGFGSYYDPFEEFGKCSSDDRLLETPEEISLVLFTGGADISPALYGDLPSYLTDINFKRDVEEVIAFRKALKLGLPMVGVCRGAQFLCAMAGGKLIQHVTGHHSSHNVNTWDDRQIRVSSMHHQMMVPPEDAQILAWSSPRLSNVYIGSGDRKLMPPDQECEVAFFPSINAVGIQHHPEVQREHEEGFQFAGELVKDFLLN
jgi:putative glutamine amidotransferase